MDRILDILKKYGIKAVEDGYITLPKDHCFAAWRVAHRRAQGADGYELYWDVTFELRICYRDRKTAADKSREKLIERDMRFLEGLESDYAYNDNDKLDITIYTFTGREKFETEE